MTHYDYGNQNPCACFSKSLRSGRSVLHAPSERVWFGALLLLPPVNQPVQSAFGSPPLVWGRPAYERSAPTAYMFAVRLLPLLWWGIPAPMQCVLSGRSRAAGGSALPYSRQAARREPFICKMAEHRFKRSFCICTFLACDHPLP